MIKDFRFKLKWWLQERMLFANSHLGNEVTFIYKLPEQYGDFAIHPCIRYIKGGVGGYKWWMVLSPYPNYDTNKENILLFHGENESEHEPPIEWTFVKEVCGSHPQGYNSDPNLFYDGECLWVIWREWETENLPKGVPIVCTMYSKTKDGVNFSSHQAIAYNEFKEYEMQGDTSMCPIVCKYKDTLSMYASYYIYEPHLSVH